MKFPGLLHIFLALACYLAVGRGDVQARNAIEKAEASVVRIIIWEVNPANPTAEPTEFHWGGGFVVSNGDLVAATSSQPREIEKKHRDMRPYVAYMEGDAVRVLPAQLIKEDHDSNSVLYRVPGLHATPLKLNLGSVRPGDEVFAVQFPYGTSGNYSYEERQEMINGWRTWMHGGCPERIISPSPAMRNFVKTMYAQGKVLRTIPKVPGQDQKDPTPALIEHSVSVQHSLGAPLLDPSGEVIGVHSGLMDFPNCSQETTPLHRMLVDAGYDHFFGKLRSTSGWVFVSVAVGLILIAAAVVMLRRGGQPPPFPQPAPAGFPQAPAMPERGSMSRWLKARSGGSGSGGTTVAPTQLATGVKRRGVQPSGGSGDRFELRPVNGAGQTLSLDSGKFAQQNGRLILGRSQALAHILVDGTGISSRHAAIRLRDSRLYIEDLESSNGTRINGKKLKPFSDIRISAGDTIELGGMKFRLH